MTEPNAKARRSVRMTDDECWSLLRESVKGTLTTLRANGRPIALPVWFVVIERRIYISTRGKKLDRLRRDPRCSFLVEAGDRWAELRAVHLECDGRVLDRVPDQLADWISVATEEKYAPYRTSRASMPDATREVYKQATGGTIELQVTGRILSWDNRKLGVA